MELADRMFRVVELPVRRQAVMKFCLVVVVVVVAVAAVAAVAVAVAVVAAVAVAVAVLPKRHRYT